MTRTVQATTEMLHQHAEAHSRVTPLSNRAYQVTRPLLRLPPKKRAEHVGCGVLVRVGAERFLLTAAHVLDEFAGDPIYVAFHGDILQAAGRAQRTRPHAHLADEGEMMDAAVMRLEDASLPGKDDHFLELRDLDVRDWMSPTKNYLLYGFPWGKSKADLPSHRIDGDSIRALCPLAGSAKRKEVGRPLETHVVFDLNPSAMVSESGVRQMTHPKGMSGCGLWSLPELDDPTSIQRGKLVGIFTDFRRKQQVGIATRIFCHFELMRNACPEIVDKLPQHGGVSIRVSVSPPTSG